MWCWVLCWGEGGGGSWCWMLQKINFDVADVEFWCLQTCDVGFISRRRGGGECWMLHATRVATWSQYSRNMVATWGRREKTRWCLDVARNMLVTWLAMAATCSQHFLPGLWTGRLTIRFPSDSHKGVRS
jgi:hypothetical protein